MKLSVFYQQLDKVSTLHFIYPNGTPIPPHFHITEVGLRSKHFIDCGGQVREEKSICFQIWVANDLHHRLDPQKLKKIIHTASPLFDGQDLEIEVEYQTETIGRFDLHFDEGQFILLAKHTNCLAKDHCGIAPEKISIPTHTGSSCCSPNSGCC